MLAKQDKLFESRKKLEHAGGDASSSSLAIIITTENNLIYILRVFDLYKH